MKTTSILALLCSAAAIMSSCSSRVYERAAAYTLSQSDTYAFADTKVEGSFDKITAPASMTVTLTRQNPAEEAIVPLVVPQGSGLPTSVTFEAGQTTADLVIDLENMKAGSVIADTLRFAPCVKTLRGHETAALNISIDYTWVRMASADRTYSLLTDDVVAPTFKGREATFPVIMEEAIEAPGMYRLVNAMKGYRPESDNPTAYLVIDATNPSRVVMGRQNTSLSGVSIESMASKFLAEGHDPLLVEDAQYYGRVENGEIIFPRSESFVLWMGNDAVAANVDGSFRIVLPEKVAEVERSISRVDYGLGVEYLARQSEEAPVLDPANLSTDTYAQAD